MSVAVAQRLSQICAVRRTILGYYLTRYKAVDLRGSVGLCLHVVFHVISFPSLPFQIHFPAGDSRCQMINEGDSASYTFVISTPRLSKAEHWNVSELRERLLVFSRQKRQVTKHETDSERRRVRGGVDEAKENR